MTIKEIFEKVLILSGQYHLSVDQIDLDYQAFVKLVKHTLTTFNRWFPRTIRYNKNIPETFYTFSDAEGIPDWVSECNPIQVLGMPWQLFDWRKQKLQEKQSFVWEYHSETHTLYVQAGGLFEIIGVIGHKITVPVGKEDSPQDWEITTINEVEHDKFFELLAGRFMYTVGLARGSFGGLDLGFTINSQLMLDEGKRMISEATSWLEKNGKQYLAWG